MTQDLPIGAALDGWTPPPLPERKVLEGRFARIEPLEGDAHAADLNDAFDRDIEGRMWTYLPHGPFASRAAFHRWIRELSKSADPLFFAVRDRASQRSTGILGLMRMQPDNGTVELGHIAFSPLLQRTPAATEAVTLLAREVFRLGYRRLEWKCDALNQPSRRAAQRIGFSYEGVFRQHMIVKGRNRDTAWFAMTDGDLAGLGAAWAQWLRPENFLESGRQVRALSDMTRQHLVLRDPTLP